jgi:hypothetical protein
MISGWARDRQAEEGVDQRNYLFSAGVPGHQADGICTQLHDDDVAVSIIDNMLGTQVLPVGQFGQDQAVVLIDKIAPPEIMAASCWPAADRKLP